MRPDPNTPEGQQYYREEIQRRIEVIRQWRAEGTDELIIRGMVIVWAKSDELDGFKRPKSTN